MAERLRHEIMDETFFEVPVWDSEGNICPAPKEVVDAYERLKEEWMAKQPKSKTEIPSVILYPIYQGEKQGYVVATQIVYFTEQLL